MTIEEKREKNRLKNIEWRKKNPEKYLRSAANYRNNNRKKLQEYKWKERYGITPEHYNEMWASQNGKCAICGNEETARHNYTKKTLKLAVDHCHKTGKVRELLCQDCNRGIAKLKEDPTILQKAIEYIIKHQNEEAI